MCNVTDPDMLVLEFTDDADGEARRREGYKLNDYARIAREGFPKGFMTVCRNCQAKIRAERRRKRLEAK